MRGLSRNGKFPFAFTLLLVLNGGLIVSIQIVFEFFIRSGYFDFFFWLPFPFLWLSRYWFDCTLWKKPKSLCARCPTGRPIKYEPLDLAYVKNHKRNHFCRGKPKLHVLVNEYEDGAVVDEFFLWNSYYWPFCSSKGQMNSKTQNTDIPKFLICLI